MDNTSTILMPIAFVLFLTLTLASYFYLLKHEKWFSWKRNLLIIGVGFLLIVIFPLITHLITNDLNVIMMIGIIVAGPTIGYSLASVKVFLNKNHEVIQPQKNKKG